MQYVIVVLKKALSTGVVWLNKDRSAPPPPKKKTDFVLIPLLHKCPTSLQHTRNGLLNQLYFL